jgi:hypothetical protein
VPDERPFREMSELAARVFGPVAALTKIEMPGDIDARYRASFTRRSQPSRHRTSVAMMLTPVLDMCLES